MGCGRRHYSRVGDRSVGRERNRRGGLVRRGRDLFDALRLTGARCARRLRGQLLVDRLRPQACAFVGRQLLESEVEDLLERGHGVWADFVDCDRPPELLRDRRERRVLEAARRDPLGEGRRVEVDVQRVAVRRHPLRDVDADRRNLSRQRPALDPDPGQAFDSRRLDPNGRERSDQRLLEVAAVALDVLAVPRQVEDRVADELAGPVVRRLAAAVGLDDVDLGTLRDVKLALLGASPERDHRRMLQEHHGVGIAPCETAAASERCSSHASR